MLPLTGIPHAFKRTQSLIFGFQRTKNGTTCNRALASTSPTIPLLPQRGALFSSFPRLRSGNSSASDNIRRFYFTNGQRTKTEDPYAVLGLQWGDGASTMEIRAAFRARAKALHPDVVDTTVMSVEQAHEEFQKLVGAYETLMKHVKADDSEDIEEWRVALWRQSDRIALDRTDVAGVARKRPAKPAQTAQSSFYSRELGHPSGKGVFKRGEYLSGSDESLQLDKKKLRSSSVGRGQSKWVKTKREKEYKEWNPSR